MPEKCQSIIEIMEKIAPPYLAQSWDNVGLLVGDSYRDVQNIMVTLDVTMEVVDEAINKNVDLIISHHPLIFKPIKSINKSNPLGKTLHRLIKHEIAVYCSHTNLDSAPNGTNQVLAQIIGLKDIKPFIDIEKEKYYKLAVFVPQNHMEKVRTAICEAGAGFVGNYSNCTFRTEGTGTFTPLEDTKPYYGAVGELESVLEYKLETIVSSENLPKVIQQMLEAHPYEEVAYDLIPLLNKFNKYGMARVGYLSNPMKLSLFCEELKNKLGLNRVKTTGDRNSTIYKVAVCAGSGSEFIEEAHKVGCDCFITGDVKYHDAQYALQLGLTLIDGGHFETERFISEALSGQLNKLVKENAYDVNVFLSNTYINPFLFL